MKIQNKIKDCLSCLLPYKIVPNIQKKILFSKRSADILIGIISIHFNPFTDMRAEQSDFQNK
jgi:hypothetical protein